MLKNTIAMPVDKERKQAALSVVKKASVKIIKMKPVKMPDVEENDKHLSPANNPYNTAYIKPKKNDPL